MSNLNEDFGTRIADLIKNIPTAQLADYIGVSVPTVKQWALGRCFPYKTAREPMLAILENRYLVFKTLDLSKSEFEYLKGHMKSLVNCHTMAAAENPEVKSILDKLKEK